MGRGSSRRILQAAPDIQMLEPEESDGFIITQETLTHQQEVYRWDGEHTNCKLAKKSSS